MGDKIGIVGADIRVNFISKIILLAASEFCGIAKSRQIIIMWVHKCKSAIRRHRRNVE